ncbi:MAG: flagellar protein FlaG [Bacillota bacterium]|nr:MAG: flagellar biosynthesis protein FlaG [Bacillota bacterium]
MEITRVLPTAPAGSGLDRTPSPAPSYTSGNVSQSGGNAAAPAPASVDLPEVGQWDAESLEKAVGRLNETARIFARSFRFYVDEATDRIVVKIIDTLTGEVIGQVPPEEVLRVAAGIREFLGLLVDRRA